jgi:hypothetical protein
MQRIIIFLILAAAAVYASADAQEQPGRITRIEFRPATPEEGAGIIISMLGSGRCTYTIDFGDGKTEQRTAELPDRVQHTYPDGEYTVVATPQAPCEGVARAKLDVRAINRGIWSLSGEPGPATDALELLVTVHGRGSCVVTLDYGDNASEKFEAALPTTRSHKYANPGTYELKATTAEPCRGEAAMRVDIKR